MDQKLIIIGAGASGLIAAITAARRGANVTILEANDKPGQKLLATGNGKCNLTNLDQDPSHYHSSDPAFLQSVLEQFPLDATIAFFTSLGLSVKNRDGWVYPVTEQSQSVLNVLLMEAEHHKIRIKTREKVVRILPMEDGTYTVYTATWQYTADRVMIACGSPASAVRGSSADALTFAKELGLSCEEFLPSLVPLRVRGDFCGKWAGVRVHGRVSLLIDDDRIASDEGTIQLTDYGLSGIPVLQISREAVRALSSGEHRVRVCLDLLPGESEESILALLAMRQKLCPYKSLRQLLSGLIPERLIPIVATKKATLETVASRLHAFYLDVTAPASMKHAQVCSGGIRTDNLTGDLEAKRHPGLFVAGEALDLDGMCGGYNLQACFATGFVAGRAAAEASEDRKNVPTERAAAETSEERKS
jgi:predicted Rossmann fold flavoprotein